MFREKIDIRRLVSSNSHFHPLLSFGNNPQLMTTLSIVVGLCIGVLDVYKMEALGVLMSSLEFCSLECG